MAAQLNYTYSTPLGVPGGKADLVLDVVVTRINEENDDVLKNGMGVVAGTVVGTDVKLPKTGATAASFEGIVLASGLNELDMSGHLSVKKNVTLNILKKGKVYASVVDAATPTVGGTAYLVISGADAGKFASASGSNTLDVGVKFGKRFDVANGVAEVIM